MSNKNSHNDKGADGKVCQGQLFNSTTISVWEVQCYDIGTEGGEDPLLHQLQKNEG